MSEVKPAKLAYNVFEPIGNADVNLSPVIFLHGVTGTKEHWRNIPQDISNGTKRKAYALDARNHGDSEYTDVYNFDLNTDDLFHFMDSMKISKAVLVGHSMGGITAIKSALRNPERVEAIFVEDMYTKKCTPDILDAVYEITDPWIKGVQNIPKGLAPQEAIGFAANYMSKHMPAENIFLNDNIMDSYAELKETPDGGYDVKFNKDVIMKSFKDHNNIMADPSGQYNGPAYFIYGSISPLYVDKEEAHIRKHFPQAELIKFENATHDVHLEYPEKFSDTILQYLK